MGLQASEQALDSTGVVLLPAELAVPLAAHLGDPGVLGVWLRPPYVMCVWWPYHLCVLLFHWV